MEAVVAAGMILMTIQMMAAEGTTREIRMRTPMMKTLKEGVRRKAVQLTILTVSKKTGYGFSGEAASLGGYSFYGICACRLLPIWRDILADDANQHQP